MSQTSAGTLRVEFSPVRFHYDIACFCDEDEFMRKMEPYTPPASG